MTEMFFYGQPALLQYAFNGDFNLAYSLSMDGGLVNNMQYGAVHYHRPFFCVSFNIDGPLPSLGVVMRIVLYEIFTDFDEILK